MATVWAAPAISAAWFGAELGEGDRSLRRREIDDDIHTGEVVRRRPRPAESRLHAGPLARPDRFQDRLTHPPLRARDGEFDDGG